MWRLHCERYNFHYDPVMRHQEDFEAK